MNSQGKFTHICSLCGVFFIIACCFFIPLSTSLMGGTAALFFFFWIVSGKLAALPGLLLEKPLTLISLLLFGLLTVGLLYSPASMDDSLSMLKKYRELLFFIAVVSLLKNNSRGATYALYSFIGGCVLLLFISYGMYYAVIPSEKYGYSTIYHITHSFFMAVLAFYCLQKIFSWGWSWWQLLWLPLFIVTSLNLVNIAPGRTGMLVYVALIILTLIQRLRPLYTIVATLVACAILVGAYNTSQNLSTRVSEAVQEIQNYQPGSSRTSLGMRFDWWLNSISLIKEKPLLGHGTGSFRTVQAELTKDSGTKGSSNPHNEYLLIAVQTGLVGLGLFVALLGGLFISSFKLQNEQKYLLQGVVVAMASGCLVNSFLLDSHQGHFFTIIAAVLYSTGSDRSARLG